jgi:hypothetical protein
VHWLLAHPGVVLFLDGHAVWHAPQWSGVWSDTQWKLSGRSSGPGQQAGAPAEHGPVSLPQVQVPTQRLVAVREQV